jgi:hypothetical protein
MIATPLLDCGHNYGSCERVLTLYVVPFTGYADADVYTSCVISSHKAYFMQNH